MASGNFAYSFDEFRNLLLFLLTSSVLWPIWVAWPEVTLLSCLFQKQPPIQHLHAFEYGNTSTAMSAVDLLLGGCECTSWSLHAVVCL